MQILTPANSRSRVGFIVPMWNPELERQGIPFRSITVAGALYHAGHEVLWLDQQPDLVWRDEEAAFLDALADVDVVFFWMNDLDPGNQTENTLALANMIKETRPDITVAVGGPLFDLGRPEALFVDTPIDYFIRGYGEQSCPDLMEALAGSCSLDDVSGLVWRDAAGAWRANPMGTGQQFRPEHAALYHLLDMEDYAQRGGIFGNGEPTFIVGTGRGCAKRCDFCYWYNHKTSLLDPQSIVDIVVALRERWGVRQFHLAELDFFTNLVRPLAVAERWRERLPDSRWFALVSPVDCNELTDAQWDTLAAGGCAKLEIGSESGSVEHLRRLGKPHDPEDSITITKRCLARDIRVMHNFVFGVPGETDADRAATLDLIRRLHALDTERVVFSFRFFQPAFDTPLGDVAIARSPTYPRTVTDIPGFRTFYGDPDSRSMQWLTPREEWRIKRLCYYWLPVMVSQHRYERVLARLLFRLLRSLAAIRVRRRWFRWDFDRKVYTKLLAKPLGSSYLR